MGADPCRPTIILAGSSHKLLRVPGAEDGEEDGEEDGGEYMKEDEGGPMD